MRELTWPETIGCHDRDPHAHQHPHHLTWVQRRRGDDDPYEEMFRTCGFCGSIHPGDLFEFLVGREITPCPQPPPALTETETAHLESAEILDLHQAHMDAWRVRRDTWAGLTLADMKYGWPHKFYVKGIPNPRAGQEVISWRYRADRARLKRPELAEWVPDDRRPGRGSWREPAFRSPAPATVPAKFYSTHLRDLTGVPESFTAFTDLISSYVDVSFRVNGDGQLAYRLGRPSVLS